MTPPPAGSIVGKGFRGVRCDAMLKAADYDLSEQRRDEDAGLKKGRIDRVVMNGDSASVFWKGTSGRLMEEKFVFEMGSWKHSMQ